MDVVIDDTPAPSLETEDGESLLLATYAQRAYLEYALSVVKGRALPDVCDGQKPVQRRILYAMSRMGLGYSGPQGSTAAKPVKCARVVGDVLGKFHPHGDSAAYDALVRMAQDFHQRYPLIDGQGNFGSRDGDGAAAMRYTEARLSKIATLLLSEVDEGTVDYIGNYDGSTEEPRLLPARLPFVLLNGASGIAVGMATEIPSHNLREVAQACTALLRDPTLTDEALLHLVPGPDFPGGGQLISPREDILRTYQAGRGSLLCRARWLIEPLARNQWQLVVTELPPGVSAQRVLEEIEERSNPKVKVGKKGLSPEQLHLKAAMLSAIDEVRDESGKEASVRLVIEPKGSKVDQDELVRMLLAHTSLECTVPINLTVVGRDGKPTVKPLRTLLEEWIAFRQETVTRRTRHRLDRVEHRIHILEGRALVLLHIDEVIALIRESDEPKSALIARFGLSDTQAEDILEIRLRQLARLEAIAIEKELGELRSQREALGDILGNSKTLQRLLIREIEADAKTFGDERRTRIQAEQRVVAEVKVLEEPVTVIVSRKGWVRAQKGWARDRSAGMPAPEYTFKAGDALYATFECRSTDSLLVFGSNGRVYTVAVSSLPGGRGDGQPITSLIDLEPNTEATHFFAGAADALLLLAGSGGYGFLVRVEDMLSRFKAGKAFLTVHEGEYLCKPSVVDGGALSGGSPAAPTVACVSTGGRVLAFPVTDLKAMPNGGRGLVLMELGVGEALAGAAAFTHSVRVDGITRSGQARSETLDQRSLKLAMGVRGRKGKRASFGFVPNAVVRVG
ncbi:DNA topoisomerase IV subunit A [Candidatus Symbiobacter mobilis]|uniref:DNA topoisomerase 4 subunit A n=1 Tax=Candidatus Symbiobacter mobilis CR TaxID=946483 RepID=U5NC60_9BURK|nr:DNA topoisomerase IV subunit A [Candidatus Symbiobacter mobilis]AGX87774.1 topoisomerase IV subunit A [Candidatus Symbiobacter mobilis CR]